MRINLKTLLLSLAMLILAAVTSRSQEFDPDPNLPDTVWIDSVITSSSTGVIPVGIFNDEELVGISVTLGYDSPDLVLDSFSFAGGRVSYVGIKGVTVHPGADAFTAYVIILDESPLPPGNGIFGYIYFSFSQTLGPLLVTINDAVVINSDAEYFTSFNSQQGEYFIPQVSQGYLDIRSSACCIGDRGNVDNDPLDEFNILDLTYMIDDIFRGGPGPVCPEEANFDNDPAGEVTILDLTFMVDNIFRGGPDPGPCP